MTFRKKLIEVALPLEDINREALREKSIRHGHPSMIHLWWARRPLVACRAVIFASMVDDPGEYIPDENLAGKERKRLLEIIKKLVVWENSRNKRILEQAKLEIAKSIAREKNIFFKENVSAKEIEAFLRKHAPIVLDPFCGGGSIPIEAQRLGLSSEGRDLNPIAVLITRALIELPQKFANKSAINPETLKQKGIGLSGWIGVQGLANDVTYYGKWLLAAAEKQLGKFYPKVTLENGSEATVIAWLWVRTVECSNPICKGIVPLVRTYWLSSKKGKEVWVDPVIDTKKKKVTFTVKTGKGTPSPGTIVKKRGAICPFCGTIISLDYIRKQGKQKSFGIQHMATVIEGDKGRLYLKPDGKTEEIAEKAVPKWAPDMELPNNPRYIAPPLYGMTNYSDIFTSRQLTALTTFIDLIPVVRKQVLQDAVTFGLVDDGTGINEGGTAATAYADAIVTYLSFAIGRAADYWATTATWYPANQQIGHTFSRQAIPMVWDFAEANPLSNSSGSWKSLCRTTADAFRGFPEPTSGLSRQQDSSSVNELEDKKKYIISTDPPYYDNIGYSDLSDFFYIWLRKSLGKIYPDLFSTLLGPKTQELVANPYRFAGDKDKAKQFFQNGMSRAFTNMLTIQDPKYPLTVFYAFKQSKTEDASDVGPDEIVASSTGWETMLEGIIRSGFSITGTWPMRSEQHHRMVAHGTNALASSIVLVCRPRAANSVLATRKEFITALKNELPPSFKKLQDEYIEPVDLQQSAIGPGMGVYTRYAKVLEADGHSMTIKSALQIINKQLDEYLTSHDVNMDSETRFCISWYTQYGWKEGPFGIANTLSTAKGTAVNALEAAGLVNAKSGKVRLLKRDELSDNWDPTADKKLTVWECLFHLVKRLESDGESSAAEILRKMGGGVSQSVRELTYRLFALCEKQGWAEDALMYNILISAWPALSDSAQFSTKSSEDTKKGIKDKSQKKLFDLGDDDDEGVA